MPWPWLLLGLVGLLAASRATAYHLGLLQASEQTEPLISNHLGISSSSFSESLPFIQRKRALTLLSRLSPIRKVFLGDPTPLADLPALADRHFDPRSSSAAYRPRWHPNSLHDRAPGAPLRWG